MADPFTDDEPQGSPEPLGEEAQAQYERIMGAVEGDISRMRAELHKERRAAFAWWGTVAFAGLLALAPVTIYLALLLRLFVWVAGL